MIIRDTTDDSTAFLQSMAANIAREDNTAYDIARSFEQLIDTHGVTVQAIAKACGKTTGYVSQHATAMRLVKQYPMLDEPFKCGKVPFSFFRLFSRLDAVKDKRFIRKLVTLALGGASITILQTRLDAYVISDPDSRTKRGAAAHVKNQSTVTYRDYRSADTRKLVKRATTAQLVQQVSSYQDKLKHASSVSLRRYYQGCVDAMEYAMGLLTSGNQ